MVNLRRFNKNDAISYLKIADEERSYFPFGFCDDLQEAEDVIDTYMHSREIDAYAIIEEDILIGVIYAETYQHIEKYTVEISYFIGKEFRKRGYVIEALKEIERILIENSQVQKVILAIHPKNVASIKTAIKFGASFCKSQKSLDYYEKVII